MSQQVFIARGRLLKSEVLRFIPDLARLEIGKDCLMGVNPCPRPSRLSHDFWDVTIIAQTPDSIFCLRNSLLHGHLRKRGWDKLFPTQEEAILIDTATAP
jgi:hypothetical protein